MSESKSRHDAADFAGDYVTLGKITTVYGVRGWLKVHSYTDPVDNVLNYREWWLRKSHPSFAHTAAAVPQGDPTLKVSVVDGRRHNKGIVVQLDGYEDREASRALAQFDILVPASALPRPGEGEYYWHQLQGMTVVDAQGDHEVMGTVDGFLETGANDVMVVKTVSGGEELIPWLPEHVVKRVDMDKRIIEVVWQSPA